MSNNDATPAPDPAESPPAVTLTPALQQLLQILIDDSNLSVVEIAARLFKSPGTVRKQIEEIRELLGVSTRAGIVARAWKWNLVRKPGGNTPPAIGKKARKKPKQVE